MRGMTQGKCELRNAVARDFRFLEMILQKAEALENDSRSLSIVTSAKARRDQMAGDPT
ncbi:MULTISPECIES: hypothetical protein [unclassified Bradyrhizobium]|uniref:hypothetical protein n=1 Tax=unclassified Bradyrhizobium TaxID=2631580 RepID=UPI00247832AC|nr:MULTISPECIES: hypothetical protein [unclassified Bradyrhizobium]WGS22642.1 hypothetical protein MTX22_13845 [Bradyrhizobium sp. ISRA463]WGS29629.1 hypothetical protein MTX19_11615 [Bradyrhizobium sp. ISRA464]